MLKLTVILTLALALECYSASVNTWTKDDIHPKRVYDIGARPDNDGGGGGDDNGGGGGGGDDNGGGGGGDDNGGGGGGGDDNGGGGGDDNGGGGGGGDDNGGGGGGDDDNGGGGDDNGGGGDDNGGGGGGGDDNGGGGGGDDNGGGGGGGDDNGGGGDDNGGGGGGDDNGGGGGDDNGGSDSGSDENKCPVKNSSEEYDDVCQYYLYKNNNPNHPPEVIADCKELLESGIEIENKMVILVHGHDGSADTSLNPGIRTELFKAETLNIISANCPNFNGNYLDAVRASDAVGKSLANLINEMVIAKVAELNRTHIVGFNIGAHVAGIAGREIEKIQNEKIARITGLDPSRDRWEKGSARLRETDAKYVEVIHTDGGLFGNGIGEDIGHADFFANGGKTQPNCFSNTCCHNRAHELFAASIGNPNLKGRLCANQAQMDLNLCRGREEVMGNNDLIKFGVGIYRVNTKGRFPF